MVTNLNISYPLEKELQIYKMINYPIKLFNNIFQQRTLEPWTNFYRIKISSERNETPSIDYYPWTFPRIFIRGSRIVSVEIRDNRYNEAR